MVSCCDGFYSYIMFLFLRVCSLWFLLTCYSGFSRSVPRVFHLPQKFPSVCLVPCFDGICVPLYQSLRFFYCFALFLFSHVILGFLFLFLTFCFSCFISFACFSGFYILFLFLRVCSVLFLPTCYSVFNCSMSSLTRAFHLIPQKFSLACLVPFDGFCIMWFL